MDPTKGESTHRFHFWKAKRRSLPWFRSGSCKPKWRPNRSRWRTGTRPH